MNLGNVRLFLWFTLFAFGWLTYTAWVTDHAPPPVAQAPPVDTSSAQGAPPSIPVPDLPDLGSDAPDGTSTVTPQLPDRAPQELVHVRTDVLDITIDLHGGDIVRAELLEYPVDKDEPDRLVRLLDYEPSNRWVFETGLVRAAEGPEPNHLARFSAPRSEYALGAGEGTLTVTLDWVEGDNVTAQKVYTFRRGSYRIDLDLELTNESAAPWRGGGDRPKNMGKPPPPPTDK
jgi:YidC/Oxa1 family membrane protein insertase